MKGISLQDRVTGCLYGGLIGDAMGAPVENWDYPKIEKEYGWLHDFEGAGTDDSAVKRILCDALLDHGGHITADEFAASFLAHAQYYDLFYIPVRNMFHKLRDRSDLPVHAGWGNMSSSSSAMAISPMGIVNAADPRTAANETYEVAGLIHAGSTSFCRDAATAMAAAVAEAMSPSSTVGSVLEAATAYLHPVSAETMIQLIRRALKLAEEAGEYRAFRERFYAECLYATICDSRETVPAAFALFLLAQGDASKAVEYGTNFGRDADTIASMLGALAGAFGGVQALRAEWVGKVEAANPDQKPLAGRMAALVRSRCEERRSWLSLMDSMQTL